MSFSEALLPEFDQEMANTRTTLERIPNDRLDWKPHPKSMDFVGLATHVANLPSWATMTINGDQLDMAPVGEEPMRNEPVGSVDEAVKTFDRTCAEAREAIAGASDERFLGPWSLLMAGETIFTMPRISVVRLWVMNHMIHHRAQLGVYLRLNDVAVPQAYGPTADEGM